jgi:hypothetical protein
VPSLVLTISDLAEETAVGAVLAMDDAKVVDAAVMNALVTADIALDDDAANPTVAASTNRLELIPQQLSSPQHQLSSPHFRTGA